MVSSVLIDRFADVPLVVSAAITIRPLRVSDILNLRPGQVLATEAPVGARVTVFASNVRIGAGDCSGAGLRVSVRMAEIGGGE